MSHYRLRRGGSRVNQPIARNALIDVAATVQRAWMVRGSNVDGYDLVPQWLEGEFVSLSASKLAGMDSAWSYEQVQQAVESGYEHKSYAYRSQRLEEFDRFLRKMSPGDLVMASRHGMVYLGSIAGEPYFRESELGLSNMRRSVRWLNEASPADAGQLRAPIPALLQSQAYVVELARTSSSLP